MADPARHGDAILYYTDEEWAEIAGGLPLRSIEGHQVALLHRHWLWADHARRWFEGEFAQRGDSDLPPHERLHEEWNASMFVWYSLLWSVIEGFQTRRVPLQGQFLRDIRYVREALRQGRHAVFHVGTDEGYFDARLFRIIQLPDSVIKIHRIHKGFARMLLEEMQRRSVADGTVDAKDGAAAEP